MVGRAPTNRYPSTLICVRTFTKVTGRILRSQSSRRDQFEANQAGVMFRRNRGYTATLSQATRLVAIFAGRNSFNRVSLARPEVVVSDYDNSSRFESVLTAVRP